MKTSTEEMIVLICTIVQTVAAVISLFVTHQVLLFVSAMVVVALLISNYIMSLKFKKLYELALKEGTIVIDKYLWDTEKKKANKLHLSDVSIDYIITDNEENPDFLDFEITYHFVGKTLSKNLDVFRIRFLLSRINKAKDVTLEVHNLARGEAPYVLAPWRDGPMLPYNVQLNTTKRNEPVDMKLVLTWKKYCLKGTPDTTLIDPRNYGKVVDRINLHLENYSKDFDIYPVTLCEYDRKTHNKSNNTRLKPADDTMRVYNYSVNTTNINRNNVLALIFHHDSPK